MVILTFVIFYILVIFLQLLERNEGKIYVDKKNYKRNIFMVILTLVIFLSNILFYTPFYTGI